MFNWNSADKLVIPLTILIIIAVAAGLHFLLRGKKDYVKKIPLQVIAVIIVLLEIAKQIYYNCFSEFTYYVLPLHFCSLFIVLMPLSQFLPAKAAQFFKPMTFVYSFLVLLLVLVNPHALLGNSNSDIFGSFHNAHTVFYHYGVIAYFIFTIALGNYTPELKHCINVSCGIVFYTSYAVPMAFHLKTNYVNILYSDFAPLEKFRISAGQAWYDIVLFLIAVAGVCLILITAYFIYKAFNKISKRKE